jgi:hypothetical protein
MLGISDPILSWNERLKRVAAFLNVIGLGMIGFAVLKPRTEDITNISLLTVWWGLPGLAFHTISLKAPDKMRKAAP